MVFSYLVQSLSTAISTSVRLRDDSFSLLALALALADSYRSFFVFVRQTILVDINSLKCR